MTEEVSEERLARLRWPIEGDGGKYERKLLAEVDRLREQLSTPLSGDEEPASARRNRAAVNTVAAALPALPPAEAERIALAVLAAALPLHESSHADSLRLAVEERAHFELEAVKLREQLAAAKQRAQSDASTALLRQRTAVLAVMAERDEWRKRAAQAEARIAEIGEVREEWGYGDAPERVTVPLAQGYRTGSPRQRAEEAARRTHLKLWTRQAGTWREADTREDD